MNSFVLKSSKHMSASARVSGRDFARLRISLIAFEDRQDLFVLKRLAAEFFDQ